MESDSALPRRTFVKGGGEGSARPPDRRTNAVRSSSSSCSTSSSVGPYGALGQLLRSAVLGRRGTSRDTVTLRAVSGGKVDFCKNACPNSPPLTSPWLPIFGTVVNGKLRLSKAVLVKNGNSLEITGTVTKGTPLSAIGFNLEDVITEGTTPMDPADCDKAIATAQ